MVAETESTPLNDIKTRHTVTGRVHAVIRGNQPRITIAEGNSAFADVQIKASVHTDGGPTMPEDLKKGELVCIENAFSRSITKVHSSSRSIRSHVSFDCKKEMMRFHFTRLEHDGTLQELLSIEQRREDVLRVAIGVVKA